nr:immunoglobulin heavy chain junction region [Mus musculus]
CARRGRGDWYFDVW